METFTYHIVEILPELERPKISKHQFKNLEDAKYKAKQIEQNRFRKYTKEKGGKRMGDQFKTLNNESPEGVTFKSIINYKVVGSTMVLPLKGLLTGNLYWLEMLETKGVPKIHTYLQGIKGHNNELIEYDTTYKLYGPFELPRDWRKFRDELIEFIRREMHVDDCCAYNKDESISFSLAHYNWTFYPLFDNNMGPSTTFEDLIRV